MCGCVGVIGGVETDKYLIKKNLLVELAGPIHVNGSEYIGKQVTLVKIITHGCTHRHTLHKSQSLKHVAFVLSDMGVTENIGFLVGV